ncbi:MAG: formate dehydrogenase subunit gamma [Desulfobulbaceae bacterium]|jgi:formate dehydrogenase subunit gamma|nr:formate dehydrogenase subunit gamma [Desulfobulbaceae bacterium]
MNSNSTLLQRHTPQVRANHWFVVIAFTLVALSGLAFFHPAFYFLSNLFGGGPWARILHPFAGVVLFLAFLLLVARQWRHNRITAADRQWQQQMMAIMMNRGHDLPEIGRYNIGQKYLFRTLLVMIPLLFLTGIVIWQPYFAPEFPIGVVRLAVMTHAIVAFIAMISIIVHIYAAYWTKGAIRGMIRGTVTAAWAKHHYPGWYKEMTKGRE